MEFTDRQKNIIDIGKMQHLDVSWYARPEFNPDQMMEILRGLEHDLDVSSYAKPIYSAREMKVKRQTLDKYLVEVNYERYPRAIQYVKRKFGEEYLDRVIGDDDYLGAITVALFYNADVSYVDNIYLSSEKREKFRWYIFDNETDAGIESVCECEFNFTPTQKSVLNKLYDRAKKNNHNMRVLNLVKDELSYEQIEVLLEGSLEVDDIAPYANPAYSHKLMDLLLFRAEEYRIENETDLNPHVVYEKVVKDIFGSGVIRYIDYDFSYPRIWCTMYELYTNLDLCLAEKDDKQVEEVWRDLYFSKPSNSNVVKPMNFI